jgi:hypothetical protein
MKVYTLHELIIAKAKSEEIEKEILKLEETFDEVVSVSRALDNAAKAIEDAIKAMLAMPPGRVRV